MTLQSSINIKEITSLIFFQHRAVPGGPSGSGLTAKISASRPLQVWILCITQTKSDAASSGWDVTPKYKIQSMQYALYQIRTLKIPTLTEEENLWGPATHRYPIYGKETLTKPTPKSDALGRFQAHNSSAIYQRRLRRTRRRRRRTHCFLTEWV